MAILLQHQDQIRTAMQLANHPPSMAEGASAPIISLNRYKRSGTAYPFQQDEVTAAINRCAKNNAVKKSKLQLTHHKHPTRVQTWQHMLTAKYAGIKDAQGSAIAYGVYIPREGGGASYDHHCRHINRTGLAGSYQRPYLPAPLRRFGRYVARTTHPRL